MKFLFHHRIASHDGQAVHLEELVFSLRKLGHEVIIVGPAGFNQQEFGNSNKFIDFLKRSLPASFYECLEVVYNVYAFFRLYRALKEHRPDVVYERFNLYLLAGVMVRAVTGIPLLLEVNSPLFEERQKNDSLALHGMGKYFQGLIWRHADRLFPVSGVLSTIVQNYGVPAERIQVVPNGINAGRFAAPVPLETAKASFGLSGQTVIGLTCFVRTWHKMDQVISFLAEHGERLNLHLLLVGDGPARASLEAQAETLGIKHRFTVTGVVQRDDVINYISAFDIALQPMLPEYASPLKLFEYMYLSRPIAAPDMDNIREVLTADLDALLFDPDRPETLHSTLLRLCEDKALRETLGQQARQTIERRGFTWDNNARRVTQAAAELSKADLGDASSVLSN